MTLPGATARSRTRGAPMTLAATLAAALILSMGAVAGAQVDGAVSVSGTSTLVGQLEAGTSSFEDGVLRTRGTKLVTIEAADDPRVSGQAVITLNVDAFRDAAGSPIVLQVRYGEMRLVNDAGTWVGDFAGRFSAGGFTQTYWLRGEGAYEGLTYVVTAGGNGAVWLTSGLIYPGEPPSGIPGGRFERGVPGGGPPLATR